MPDRHKKTKSKYTLDRNMPGAFEGETVTRRNFMNATVQGAGAIAAAGFTLPALGFAIGPIFDSEKLPWQSIGTTTDFPNTTYATRIITLEPGVGEVGKSLVYVRARDPSIDTEHADQYNQFIAISSRCMHLGCPVRFTAAANRFICPCHGGVYDFRGIRTGGPPVRPLDRFYTRVVGNDVQVGPRYSVNNELRRFSPRLPGQPLDGIGQYAYPKQFDTPGLSG